MKPILRALVWLGLGGGIGFFAGWRLGYNKDKSEIEAEYGRMLTEDQGRIMESCEERINEKIREKDEQIRSMREQYEAAVNAIREYKGLDNDIDGDNIVSIQEEEPEMPEEEPEMPDDPLGGEEIEQLHPEDLLPFGITKAEYQTNEKGYDLVDLDYYTEDCVIFDPKREEKWTHPEQLLGIGWKARFISPKGDPRISEIYIQNDTMETLYRITRIDDSFERLYEEE